MVTRTDPGPEPTLIVTYRLPRTTPSNLTVPGAGARTGSSGSFANTIARRPAQYGQSGCSKPSRISALTGGNQHRNVASISRLVSRTELLRVVGASAVVLPAGNGNVVTIDKAAQTPARTTGGRLTEPTRLHVTRGAKSRTQLQHRASVQLRHARLG